MSGSEKILGRYWLPLFPLFFHTVCLLPKALPVLHLMSPCLGYPKYSRAQPNSSHGSRRQAMFQLPSQKEVGKSGAEWLFQPVEGERMHHKPEKAPHRMLSPLPTVEALSKLLQSHSQALWSSGLWPFLSSSSVNPGPCIKQLLSPGTWFLEFQSLQPSQILCPGQTPKENCPSPQAALWGQVM